MKTNTITLSQEEETALHAYLDKQKEAGELADQVSLTYLVDRWRRLVREVEEGYTLCLDDYEYDLSSRDLLQELMHDVPSVRDKVLEVVAPLDEIFFACTVEVSKPVASMRPYPGIRSWWSRVPKKLVGDLAKDLRAEGLQ